MRNLDCHRLNQNLNQHDIGVLLGLARIDSMELVNVAKEPQVFIRDTMVVRILVNSVGIANIQY